MCRETTIVGQEQSQPMTSTKTKVYNNKNSKDEPPIKVLLEPPALLARYTCVSVLVAIMTAWGKFAFIDESQTPDEINIKMHGGSPLIPVGMTVFYLISLPLLRMLTEKFLSNKVDVKVLLYETMILYNAAQVVLNGWMVYRIMDSLLSGNHPFHSNDVFNVSTGAPYAVYVHYCDKYLEYMDTYFMILRGKMDQVSFLHIYHHTSIALAWWVGIRFYPGGNNYFGALLNSFIHVLMYSYYTMSLLKIKCPWKKYLTMAQLTQFASVLLFSAYFSYNMPEGATWKQYFALFLQCFEMTSLFVLFMMFYKKSYAAPKAPPPKLSDSASFETSLSSNSSGEE